MQHTHTCTSASYKGNKTANVPWNWFPFIIFSSSSHCWLWWLFLKKLHTNCVYWHCMNRLINFVGIQSYDSKDSFWMKAVCRLFSFNADCTFRLEALYSFHFFLGSQESLFQHVLPIHVHCSAAFWQVAFWFVNLLLHKSST